MCTLTAPFRLSAWTSCWAPAKVTQVGFFLLWHVSQVQSSHGMSPSAVFHLWHVSQVHSSSYDVSLRCILLLVACLSAALFFPQHVTQVQSPSCGISHKKPNLMIGVQSWKVMPLGQLCSCDRHQTVMPNESLYALSVQVCICACGAVWTPPRTVPWT